MDLAYLMWSVSCRFDSWIRSIDSYNGSDLLYLNSTGTIPAAAVVKKGEKRIKPFKDTKRFDDTNFGMSDGSKIVMGEEEEDTIVDKSRLLDMEG